MKILQIEKGTSDEQMLLDFDYLNPDIDYGVMVEKGLKYDEYYISDSFSKEEREKIREKIMDFDPSQFSNPDVKIFIGKIIKYSVIWNRTTIHITLYCW
jgi:hypothetical protein